MTEYVGVKKWGGGALEPSRSGERGYSPKNMSLSHELPCEIWFLQVKRYRCLKLENLATFVPVKN